jgi:hypothetical protein
MEAAMRLPFYMNNLDPEDQRTVKRWYVRIAVFYSSLALLAIVAVRINVLDPQIDAMRRESTTGVLQANRLVGASFHELPYLLSEDQVKNLCAKHDGTFRTSEGGGYWCRYKTGAQIACNGKHICTWGKPRGDRGTVGDATILGNGLYR